MIFFGYKHHKISSLSYFRWPNQCKRCLILCHWRKWLKPGCCLCAGKHKGNQDHGQRSDPSQRRPALMQQLSTRISCFWVWQINWFLFPTEVTGSQLQRLMAESTRGWNESRPKIYTFKKQKERRERNGTSSSLSGCEGSYWGPPVRSGRLQPNNLTMKTPPGDSIGFYCQLDSTVR